MKNTKSFATWNRDFNAILNLWKSLPNRPDDGNDAFFFPHRAVRRGQSPVTQVVHIQINKISSDFCLRTWEV